MPRKSSRRVKSVKKRTMRKKSISKRKTKRKIKTNKKSIKKKKINKKPKYMKGGLNDDILDLKKYCLESEKKIENINDLIEKNKNQDLKKINKDIEEIKKIYSICFTERMGGKYNEIIFSYLNEKKYSAKEMLIVNELLFNWIEKYKVRSFHGGIPQINRIKSEVITLICKMQKEN